MLSKKLKTLFRSSNATESENIELLPGFSTMNDPFNGLNFNGIYIPAEIIVNILTNLSPQDILACSLVCKNWFNITRSPALWQSIYNEKEYPKKAKALPWYVFYCYFATDNFKNLIKNGNGEEQFKYWEIILNGGHQFVVEAQPYGSDALPEGISEFHGHSSCFATSFEDCSKYQKVDLRSKKLLRHIIRKHKPTLYGSEWYAGRFDCACIYRLLLICEIKQSETSSAKMNVHHFSRNDRFRSLQLPTNFSQSLEKTVEQWSGKAWEKVELLYKDYPQDVESIIFLHRGKDLQFWAGHFGSKMAGGVLKFLFDSIEPISEDIEDVLVE